MHSGAIGRGRDALAAGLVDFFFSVDHIIAGALSWVVALLGWVCIPRVGVLPVLRLDCPYATSISKLFWQIL